MNTLHRRARHGVTACPTRHGPWSVSLSKQYQCSSTGNNLPAALGKSDIRYSRLKAVVVVWRRDRVGFLWGRQSLLHTLEENSAEQHPCPARSIKTNKEQYASRHGLWSQRSQISARLLAASLGWSRKYQRSNIY